MLLFMGQRFGKLGLRRAALTASAVAVLGIAGFGLVPQIAQGQSRTVDARSAAATSAPADISSPAPGASASAAAPAPPPIPTAVPTAAPLALPTPAPLPGRWDKVPLTDIGRIQIPRTGLDQPVREGVEQMVIDAGPAHWRGTAAFGAWGNVVIAGHRSLHTEPFLRNAGLQPGDEIILSDATGAYWYRVTGNEVVDESALWIVDQHPGRTLTIFTCHPIGSSALRLVTRAELTSAPRTGA